MASERKFLSLDAERHEAQSQGVPFAGLAEWHVASSVLEKTIREVDDVALTWHATYRLIQSCLTILRSGATTSSATQFALLTTSRIDPMDLVLEVDKEGEREFELLDSVCQSAVWFESVDPSVANLKRMRRFDSFLQRNGSKAVFCDMNESEALLVGNELAKFMFTQFSRNDVNALFAGKKTLSAMGVDAERQIRELLNTAASSTRRKALGS